MENDRRVKNILGFSALTIIVAYFVLNYLAISKTNYEASFSGKIKKIEYDAKSQPTVQIGSGFYGFTFGRNTGELMVGDSLVKASKSNLVYQYRDGVLIKKYNWGD